jgi:hypothetical protein
MWDDVEVKVTISEIKLVKIFFGHNLSGSDQQFQIREST